MPIASILSVSANGIECQWFSEGGTKRHTETIPWSGIRTVDIFKRDVFAYDLICLQVYSQTAEPAEFDEEDPHWKSLISVLPVHLPGREPFEGWFNKVAFPAFELNLRRIFERGGG